METLYSEIIYDIANKLSDRYLHKFYLVFPDYFQHFYDTRKYIKNNNSDSNSDIKNNNNSSDNNSNDNSYVQNLINNISNFYYKFNNKLLPDCQQLHTNNYFSTFILMDIQKLDDNIIDISNNQLLDDINLRFNCNKYIDILVYDFNNIKTFSCFMYIDKCINIIPKFNKLKKLYLCSYYKNNFIINFQNLFCNNDIIQDIYIMTNDFVDINKKLYNLKYFKIHNSPNIKKLDYLQYSINIKKLSLINCQIDNYPIELMNLINLEYLNLKYNKLKNLLLPESDCDDTNDIDDKNNIENKTVDNFHIFYNYNKLKYLNLRYNQIDTIYLDNLKSLNELYLFGNPIENIINTSNYQFQLDIMIK